MKLHLIIALQLCSACFQGEEVAQTKSGAAAVNEWWYKTPTEIANTVKNSWGLRLEGREEHKYITQLGPFYGSIDKLLQKATLEKPTSGYVLALDLVSAWLSNKLIEKEKDEPGFLFNGGVDTEEDPKKGHSCYEYAVNYCYKMNAVEWCDCEDGVELGQYDKKPLVNISEADFRYLEAHNHSEEAKRNVHLRQFSIEDKKRIMHNIQDIGDFLGMAIDNKLVIEGQRHAARYLLEEVFIPNLAPPEGTPKPKADNNMDYDCGDACEQEMLASDHEAWVKVVYTIMMSGPFYMNLQMVRGE